MAVVLDGNSLTVEQVVRVARLGEKVELTAESEARINRCRRMVEKKIEAGEVMYGINTGIGEFSETMLSDEEVKQF